MLHFGQLTNSQKKIRDAEMTKEYNMDSQILMDMVKWRIVEKDAYNSAMRHARGERYENS